MYVSRNIYMHEYIAHMHYIDVCFSLEFPVPGRMDAIFISSLSSTFNHNFAVF